MYASHHTTRADGDSLFEGVLGSSSKSSSLSSESDPPKSMPAQAAPIPPKPMSTDCSTSAQGTSGSFLSSSAAVSVLPTGSFLSLSCSGGLSSPRLRSFFRKIHRSTGELHTEIPTQNHKRP